MVVVVRLTRHHRVKVTYHLDGTVTITIEPIIGA